MCEVILMEFWHFLRYGGGRHKFFSAERSNRLKYWKKNDLVNVVDRLAHDVLQRDIAKRQFQNMQKNIQKIFT